MRVLIDRGSIQKISSGIDSNGNKAMVNSSGGALIGGRPVPLPIEHIVSTLYFSVQFPDVSQCWYGLSVGVTDDMTASDLQGLVTDLVTSKAGEVQNQAEVNAAMADLLGDGTLSFDVEV